MEIIGKVNGCDNSGGIKFYPTDLSVLKEIKMSTDAKLVLGMEAEETKDALDKKDEEIESLKKSLNHHLNGKQYFFNLPYDTCRKIFEYMEKEERDKVQCFINKETGIVKFFCPGVKEGLEVNEVEKNEESK